MSKKKEILLITNYFPPEKGAAPNRMHSLATELGKNGYNVWVACPLPNYPTGKVFKNYRNKFMVTETEDFGKVFRLWVWPSNSANKIIRLISMVSFSLSLIFFFLLKRLPKKVFIQYSPIFVGYTGVFLSKLFSKRIILNVSDLWPLAGKEMGILNDGFYYSQLLKIEKYCYKNSHLIVGQSEEILEHISKFDAPDNLFLYRNIPNFKPKFPKDEIIKGEIKIVYAGLLGVAQGIYQICKKINFSENVTFHIYGSGPEASQIEALKKEHIYFHGEVERAVLHEVLQEYHLAFIPLTNRIYGSVPSKIFEYSRLGLPILYMAGGEGEDLVRENQLGWTVPVNDFKKLQQFTDALTPEMFQHYPKSGIQKKAMDVFNFDTQFTQFVRVLDAV